MGMKQLESAILAELRRVANDNRIRQKDIMEWRTRKIEPHGGETLFFLPDLGVHCAVRLPPAAKKGA